LGITMAVDHSFQVRADFKIGNLEYTVRIRLS